MSKNIKSISAVDILSNKINNNNKKTGNMNIDVYSSSSESSSDYESESMDESEPEPCQTPMDIDSDKKWLIDHLFNYFNTIIEYLFFKVNAPHVSLLLDKRYKIQNKNNISEEYVENHSVLRKLAENDIGDYMDSLKNLILETIFFIEHNNIKRLALIIASAENGVVMQHYPPNCQENSDESTITVDFDIISMITGRTIAKSGENIPKTSVIHLYDVNTNEYIGSVGDENERTIVEYLAKFIHVRVIIENYCKEFMKFMDVANKVNRNNGNLKEYLSSQVDTDFDQDALVEICQNYDELHYISSMCACMITTRLDKKSGDEINVISDISEMFLKIYKLLMMKLSPSQNINYSLFKSHLVSLNIKKVNE